MDNQNSNPVPQQNLTNNTGLNKPLNKADKFKRVFFQILIVCLIGAATIAVIAVLVGKFNDVLLRALGTIAMVALHAALSFSYIAESERRDKKDGGRSIELFNNTVFVLIVASFITSIFAIWRVLDPSITLRLYLLYGVVLFATLHADILYRIRKFESRIDNIVATNYFLMAIVVVMLMIVIFSPNPSDLNQFYYRLLAAAAIIDATLTITAIIMHKLYLQKHPELSVSAGQTTSAKSRNFWKNPLVILLLIYIAFQFVFAVVALVINKF